MRAALLSRDLAGRPKEVDHMVRTIWVYEDKRYHVLGLCSNRDEHRPHLVTTGSLAPYWCTANQSERLPHAAERKRNDDVHLSHIQHISSF